MASSNPAFSNSPAFSASAVKAAQLARPDTQNMSAEQLTRLYSQPSADALDTDRMTYEDTIIKIVATFAVLLGGAVVGWMLPALFIPAMIVGLVLGLVNTFKKQPSRALILLYAGVEGVFVGGITQFLEVAYPGIALQAVLATLSVVGVVLALFASGKVRASKKATKVVMIAMIGYMVFSLLNLVMMWTGMSTLPWGMRSVEVFGIPLGVIIGIFAILLASYMLVMDFDFIKTGVERGAPRIYGWTAAFGITVTVIWIYIEMLRLIAILRR